jgi:hypothetical protein
MMDTEFEVSRPAVYEAIRNFFGSALSLAGRQKFISRLNPYSIQLQEREEFKCEIIIE